MLAAGGWIGGIYTWNSNGSMMAQDYFLAYFFNISYWFTYFPGFRWKNNSRYGFAVDTHQYFLRKSFCLDFANEVIKRQGSKGKYCGMSATDIAAEMYAHAVIFYYSSSLKIFLSQQRLNSWFESSRIVDIDANDPRAWRFMAIWKVSGALQSFLRQRGIYVTF